MKVHSEGSLWPCSLSPGGILGQRENDGITKMGLGGSEVIGHWWSSS